MRILDYVPIGHNNAISRQTLAAVTRLSDRKMRDEIAEVNKNSNPGEIIINLQDGKGYFRPAPDEDNLVRIWTRIGGARDKSFRENVQAGNAYLNQNRQKKESDLEKNQMSLFDFGI